MCDPDRIRDENQKTPGLHTAQTERDLEAIKTAAGQEVRAAGKLQNLAVFGVFDGVSGRGSNGSGTLASRLSSGKAAEILSYMPADADAERARRSIEAALRSASQVVSDYKRGRRDLKEMATTADIIKLVDLGGGNYEVAYGHVGDGRIYVLEKESGKLRVETIDDGFAGNALDMGKLTREEYDMIMDAESAESLPDDLVFYFKRRNILANSLGGRDEKLKIRSGTFKVRQGDRILLSTDGVHDNLTNAQIRALLHSGVKVDIITAKAREIAESGSGRAKPDDITAVLVEVEASFGRKKEDSGGASATPERVAKWRVKAKALTNELDVLEEALRTEDRSALDDYGGAEAAQRIWRDKTIELDRLDYNILKREISEMRHAEGVTDGTSIEEVIAAADEELREARDLKNAALTKEEGKGMAVGSTIGALAEIGRRIKDGESPGELMEETRERFQEAVRRLEELQKIGEKQSQMESTAEEWRRLTAEKRQEEESQKRDEIDRLRKGLGDDETSE